MNPSSKQPTHWRAFVQGQQIGSGYQSREEAIQAARLYFEDNDNGSAIPDIGARASSLPSRKVRIRKFREGARIS